MIRAGVIGVGYLGQHHARIYSELEGVELVAIIDPDEKRTAEIAQRYGGKPYREYKDALHQVDVLSIVAPTTLHYTLAQGCIEAGKDLLIEKPITTTLQEADALIDAAARAGVVIQVGHLERFNPAVQQIHSLVNQPVFCEAERLSPFLGRATDVDVTLDLMIHDVDIVLSLLRTTGENISVSEIKATGGSILTDRLDMAKAWIQFSNGAQALLTATRVSFEKMRKLKVFQRGAYLLADYQAMEVKEFFKEDGKILHKTIPLEQKEPLKEELNAFIECVKTRRTPLVTALDGRNALEIVLEINKKIKS